MLFPSRSPATTLISDSGDGGGLRRAAATGGGSVPVINSVDLDNASPTAGDSITATVSATGADSLAYQWLADGVPISGATGSTYTTDRDNAMGHAISCQVIGTNGAGDSTPVTSGATAQVTGVPVCTVAPLNQSTGADPTVCSVANSDSLCVGAAFTGNVGTWTGFPAQAAMMFSYNWNIDGGGGSAGITPSNGDVGQSAKCTVTADNGIGAPVSADSNAITVSP